MLSLLMYFFLFKQKTAYEMRISDWSSDVCSSDLLRLLLLQEEIAERTLEMLSGAMETLIVGDPGEAKTDVGPVIDQAAYDKLMAYRERMSRRIVKTVDVPVRGLFVPPTVIRLDDMEDRKSKRLNSSH